MIIKKIFLLLMCLLLSNCGYQAIYSTKSDLNLPIKKFEFEGDKNINKKIVSMIGLKEEKQNGYKLKLVSNKIIEVISKKKTGTASIYKTTINVSLSITDQEKIIKKKQFNSSFIYNNTKNKFELEQYRRNIDSNLINKIIEDIFIFLNT